MFEVVNKTPFAASLIPTLDENGSEEVMAAVKGTYLLGSYLRVADQQAPLNLADAYWGEPAVSSLRYASDLVPKKSATDVVLIGSAHAPGREVPELDVTLEVGPVRKTIRVFGNRTWKGWVGLASVPSKPIPFSVMPLVYERAFGGGTTAADGRSARESLNPVGRGLQRREAEDTPLPNLEDPSNLIRSRSDRPEPACFGFIAPHWQWRRQFGGTFDEDWAATRCPLLPTDFNPRFYNAAHPDLISATPFRGGEPVRITNASRNGTLAFALPRVDVHAEFLVDSKTSRRPCTLDTVMIEPDENRLSLTWRASVGCHRKIKYVQGVRLTFASRDGRGSQT